MEDWPLREMKRSSLTLDTPRHPWTHKDDSSTAADSNSFTSVDSTAASPSRRSSAPIPETHCAAEWSSDVEKGQRPPERPRPISYPSGRVSRTETLTRQRRQENSFWHPQAHRKTSQDVIVDFEGPDDPYYPRNWPMRKKVITTMLYGFTAMGATFASSVYSPDVDGLASEFGISREVSFLGISLLLAGFGLGPLLWGPVSEIYGRRLTVLLPYFMAGVITFCVGSAKDIQTVMICRFFVGLFGAAPVTNVGGVLSDIWDPTQRGTAAVGYAIAVVGGPTLGPIVGGALKVSGLNWRWSEYVTAIYILSTWLLGMIVLDESYAPALLCHKASRLRLMSQNWALHAKHEEWDPSLKEMTQKFGKRPFQMLLTPICFAMALYASFVYGILYANLASLPIEFQETRGWNALVGALPFLALLVGIFIGGALNIANQYLYNARFKANGNSAVPEARLLPMMVGSIFFAAGLFLFGWTSSPHVHWIFPVTGCMMIGVGFFTIFQSSLNYLLDTFQTYAASAIAASTFLRSSFALAFPLIVDPMYHRLGITWATSVFGVVAVLLIPIPFLFYKYGSRIRSCGRFSANMG